MNKLLVVIALLLALAFGTSAWLTRPVVRGELSAETFAGMGLAPPDAAITLARTLDGEVLLLTGFGEAGVTGVDIGAVGGTSYADAAAAYWHLGREGLRALFSGPQVSRSWESLDVPITPRFPHIAAGTNYRAHARESGRDSEEPFLFPKLSTPTAWNSSVLPGARLDYEVELCAVLLDDHSAAVPAPLGYALCGDFTDRWTLVREMDLDGVWGRTGFPLAKGGDSRLPVGPLLVIPDEEDFYRSIELALYVNGTLRQQDPASKMVWSPREILERALGDCDTHYLAGDERLRLTDCTTIPAGTLILTGTPEGVLFQVPTIWNPFAYLRAGDEVTSFGTYLGWTRNRIGGTPAP